MHERAVENDPHDLESQLELFRLRLKAGKAEQGKSALAAALKLIRDERWPSEIGQYYLGNMNLEALLKEANDDKNVAKRRSCDVYRHAGALLEVQDLAAEAAQLAGRFDAECRSSQAAP